MRKVVNTVYLLTVLIPLIFTISLLSLFLIEAMRKGYWPDTIKEEAPASFFRSVIIFSLLSGYISIVIAILLASIRIFFWKSNMPSARLLVFMFVSILSMIAMVYLNPGHLFTWMMG